MNKVTDVLVWPFRKVWGLRGLVKDQDHDDWLDTHREKQQKKGPDTGRIIRGGPGGGT